MGLKKEIFHRIKYLFLGVPDVYITTQISEISQSMLLSGKNIIVTGGSKGIGKEIARKCIKHGARVVIAGRRQEDLLRTCTELGNKCMYICHDVANTKESRRFIEEADELFGDKIDALVSNAGISLHEKNVRFVTEEGFDKQVNTNLRGAYFLAQAYIEYLEKQEDTSGNILFMTSERGLYCDDIPYGLTKAAINSLTQGLARRLINNRIRVNAIAPGVTASEMTGYSSDENLYRERACGKRVYLPEEIAEVALFLLGDTSRCISGEIIACDEGNYLRCDW